MAYRSWQEDDSARRLYNPYQNLQQEYLFQEESLAQHRSWGENLIYYTGIGYLAGSSAGAARGFYLWREIHRANRYDETENQSDFKRIWATGQQFGNRCGVIGLMYAALESGMVAIRDKDDIINNVVAALGTGALYKAATGRGPLG